MNNLTLQKRWDLKKQCRIINSVSAGYILSNISKIYLWTSVKLRRRVTVEGKFTVAIVTERHHRHNTCFSSQLNTLTLKRGQKTLPGSRDSPCVGVM